MKLCCQIHPSLICGRCRQTKCMSCAVKAKLLKAGSHAYLSDLTCRGDIRGPKHNYHSWAFTREGYDEWRHLEYNETLLPGESAL